MSTDQNPPPALVAMVDQAWAASRDSRAGAPSARAERRCSTPPMGCGQPLGKPLPVAFRDRASRTEYELTGLCQSCQDELFAPNADEVAEMAADPERYGRCHVCGEYRPYEFVDVGVGVISGFSCCYLDAPADFPWCSYVAAGRRCALGADHAHGHDLKPQRTGWAQ